MFFRRNIEKFSPLLQNRYQLFLIWLRSISIISLILQVRTLVSIGTYALALHKRRKLLIDELHILGVSFASIVRRRNNRSKALLTSDKNLKRPMKVQQRAWTI